MKTVICSKYSFQKLIQSSRGNNVVDAAAYNIGGSFVKIHVFLKLN
jgi:hypothetical protein